MIAGPTNVTSKDSLQIMEASEATSMEGGSESFRLKRQENIKKPTKEEE